MAHDLSVTGVRRTGWKHLSSDPSLTSQELRSIMRMNGMFRGIATAVVSLTVMGACAESATAPGPDAVVALQRKGGGGGGGVSGSFSVAPAKRGGSGCTAKWSFSGLPQNHVISLNNPHPDLIGQGTTSSNGSWSGSKAGILPSELPLLTLSWFDGINLVAPIGSHQLLDASVTKPAALTSITVTVDASCK